MKLKNKHIIHKNIPLISALKVINTLMPEPLVLFVVDDDGKMVGTLTDGDSRRALISGCTTESPVECIMHKNFKYVEFGINDDVKSLRAIKQCGVTLLPVLDENRNIVDIINFEKITLYFLLMLC